MIEQTEFYSKDFKALNLNSLQEIEVRLRRGYLDRLGLRVKKLRKIIIERNWEKLRDECLALSISGDSFGFQDVASLAHQVLRAIPAGKIPRAATPSRAKTFAESLVTTIDAILMENSTLQI
ncbi:MAG: hypothetical protein ABIQ95_12265 [Bdellovibrionia bacterium]